MRTVVTAVRRKSTALWVAAMVMIVSLAAFVPFVLSQRADAYSEAVFSQGFEADTSGWNAGGGYGVIVREASGTSGVASASGAWHAVVSEESDVRGPFTRFDGYKDSWSGPWEASVDVYLDPSWAANEGFDYSVATNQVSGSHLRDFVAHVAKDDSTGQLLFAASTGSGFAASQNLESGDHYAVTSAGWYTITQSFYSVAGVLAVDVSLSNQAGTEVFSTTLSAPTDLIPSLVGGNRYGWFTYVDVAGGLAIDNTTLIATVPDTVRPDVSFVTPATVGQSFGGMATIDLYAEDNDLLDTMTVNIKSADNTTNIGPCGSISGLNVQSDTFTCTINTKLYPNGTYTLRAGAKDVSGNTQTIARQVVFDNQKPSVSITAPADEALTNGSFTFSGTASDALSPIDRVEYIVKTIDGLNGSITGNYETGVTSGTTTFTHDFVELPAGFYRITARAFDAAGNYKNTSIDVEVDRTAPDAPVLVSPANGAVQNGGPVQKWSHANPSDVAYYRYESYSDAAMMAPIYSTTTTNTQRTIGGAQNLTLYWRVGAVDAAGNVAWSDLWELTVDNTVPVLVIDTYTVNGGEITPDLTTTETGLTYAWTQTVGPASAVISDPTALAPTFTITEDGVYEFQIVAMDEAGNSTIRTFSFTYVTPEPTTTTSEGTDTGGDTGGTPTTTTLVNTPPIVGPGFTAVGVLGATDDATTDATNSDSAVEGASTVDTLAQAVDADNTDGTAMGLAWYWWVLIIGGVAVLIWGIVAAFRGRGNA